MFILDLLISKIHLGEWLARLLAFIFAYVYLLFLLYVWKRIWDMPNWTESEGFNKLIAWWIYIQCGLVPYFALIFQYLSCNPCKIILSMILLFPGRYRDRGTFRTKINV